MCWGEAIAAGEGQSEAKPLVCGSQDSNPAVPLLNPVAFATVALLVVAAAVANPQ